MPTIVNIENLSKKYRISHQHQAYETLRETLTSRARWFMQKVMPRKGQSISPMRTYEDFWALKDINLKISEGDRIGIIGRNGAGKSTFLKLLSRIMDPTSGKIQIKGRVSSLLEVGTGFHPELTGRENIFLNGAILGMTRSEIKKKFDEIIAFAEIEKFLDTPIKRYSSGMNARLGFAIAAHLDPDLLIVDEVLAVGDGQFQDKCLKKMNEMGSCGRTVLFVSHSISAVVALCNKGIFLDKGQLVSFEPIDACVTRYMNTCPVGGLTWKGKISHENISFFEASLNSSNSTKGYFYQEEEATFNIDFEVLHPHPDLRLGFSVWNTHHQLLARSYLGNTLAEVLTKPGRNSISFLVDMNLFHVGEYMIKLECSLFNRKKILNEEIALKFAVYPQDNSPNLAMMEKEGISLGNRWLVQSHACQKEERVDYTTCQRN